MDREQQLLAIVQAQTEIAAARPEPDAVAQIVAVLALEVIGAQAAAVELAAGEIHDHVLGTVTPHRLAAPLVHDGKPVGTLSVYADQPQAFTAADSETLTLLAGAVAAHLAHASAQAPTRQHVWDDALTGLGNRHAYERRIAHECARRRRDGGLLTLVLVDLDGPQGDGVRRTVAAVLQRWTRSIDGVYRVGEDRFALILPGADGQSGAGADRAHRRAAGGCSSAGGLGPVRRRPGRRRGSASCCTPPPRRSCSACSAPTLA